MHPAVQHLKSVRELQLLRNVESVLTFFYDIYVHKAYQEFSPSCHLAEKVEFSLDANEKILSRFRNSWFFKKNCNTVHDATECNPYVTSQPQKLCIARFECVSSSLSNYLDFLTSTAVLLELEYKCMGWWNGGLKCQRWRIEEEMKKQVSVFSKKCHWTGVCDT